MFKNTTFVLLLFSNIIFGQIISNEAFIKGNYVEVGVNNCGIFGTDRDAPLSFHARNDTSKKNLGFVADPDQDGWNIGNPKFYGDFFYPGSPQEGFSLQFDGGLYQNWNFGKKEIVGRNLAITTVGSNDVGLWEGSIKGLKIRQRTIVPKNQVFFIVRVELTNTTAVEMKDVYYLRTLDPDNEVTLTGNFSTKNAILYTLPNTNNNTLVSANGLTYTNCFLGLGTKDCRANPFIIKSSLTPGATELIENIHNKTNTTNYQYSETLTEDTGIGITYFIGNIAPGQTKKLAFTYILKQSDLEVALAQTLPEVSLNATPIIDKSSFKICGENKSQNVSVQNGDDYVWHWEPEEYFATPYGETNVLTIPKNSTVNFKVSGESNCSPFSLNFKVSSYSFLAPLKDQNHILCSGSSTSYNPIPLITSPTSTFKWYDAEVGGSEIGNLPLFTTPVLTNSSAVPKDYTYYYVETTPSGCISDRIPFKITVFNNLDLPNAELKECAVGSTITTFNLNNYIENAYDNPTYTFYSSFDNLNNNVPISNSTNYTNTVNNQIIYVKVVVNPMCYDVVELTLKVFEKFVLTPQTLVGCDDDFDNSASFDLTEKNTLVTNLPGTTFSYFLTNTDAQNNTNKITNVTDFYNSTNPQMVYVKTSNGNCFDITQLTLTVFEKTIVSPSEITKCQQNVDGSAIFDLTSQNNIINSDSGLKFSYYTTLNNLKNDVPIANFSEYQNTSNPQTVFVKVMNPNNCYSIADLKLNVTPLKKYTIANEFRCDDNYDGFVSFNLSSKIPEVASVLPYDTYSYSYYNSEKDAILGTNEIQPNYTNTTSPETVYIKANGVNNCPFIIKYDIIVLVKPVLNIQKNSIICENSTTTLDAGIGFDSYLWSTGEKTQSIVVTSDGNYSIKVSNRYGSLFCETEESISVVKSNSATITNIVINDWTPKENSISVFANGLGVYEYSLDDSNFQDSPDFNNLESGVYTVTVRDKNGCGIAKEEIYILTYPKFFTPNMDGFNDYWNIKYAIYEPNLQVTIFDRFGKYITTFKGDDKGWDGTYLGSLSPASDYWFVVNRADGKIFKGHFSLKR